MSGSAVSQFENTSWVFRVQYQMETHLTSEAVWAAESVGTPAHFSPPGPRVEGLHPGLGTQNSLG